MAEFGRTPKISLLPKHYKLPGRDHWARQTALFAGGGITGGQVVGATDKIGAYPIDDPQKPENIAATIYHSLGIPPVRIGETNSIDRIGFTMVVRFRNLLDAGFRRRASPLAGIMAWALLAFKELIVHGQIGANCEGWCVGR